METILLIIAIALVLLGCLGSFLPGLPGTPLIFLGFLVQAWSSGWTDISGRTVLIVGLIALAVQLLDFYAGALGAKRYGATRMGVWGAVFGAVVGVLAFNVVGLVLGALAGAVGAELLGGRHRDEALRAGWGAMIGLLAGGFVKAITATILTGVFFVQIAT